MSNEKKNVETEDVKEARKLSMEELEQVTGGDDPGISAGNSPELWETTTFKIE